MSSAGAQFDAQARARAGIRPLLLLFGLALAVRALAALPEAQPGYMDAAYYFDIADSVARGAGLTENFVWNYLSHPAGLPQPGNAYWMPLTSLVVAPFLRLGVQPYRAAQVPMLLLASLLVPLTFALSLHLFGRKDWALVSALLMLASSFYAPFWAAVDSFALFALLSSLVLWLCAGPRPAQSQSTKLLSSANNAKQSTAAQNGA